MKPSFIRMLSSRLKGRDFIHDFYCREKRVLDIGCGEGEFLRRDPEHIEGVEPNEDAVRRLRSEGLKATLGKLPHLPFEDESFDVVHSRNVIEHLDIPTAYSLVSEGVRVLKPRGLIILATEMPTKKFWDTFGHVKPYTPKAIRRLLREESREEFEPITGIRYRTTIYLGAYSRNKLLYFASCLIAYYLPLLRREYFLVMEKIGI